MFDYDHKAAPNPTRNVRLVSRPEDTMHKPVMPKYLSFLYYTDIISLAVSTRFSNQPTLHKPGIMAHEVRILQNPTQKTIRMHYASKF